MSHGARDLRPARLLPILFAAIATAGTGMSALVRAAPATTAPTYASPEHPDNPFWARRVTGYLPARDGTRLRFSALLPKASGKFPIIINYSGYDPGAIGGSAYLQGDTAMASNLDRSLLEAGYAVVGINARGTGCSEGVFDFLGHAYGEDGRDAVEWLAGQPWSTGAIAMANWSWAGMSQIATASERPPHLKAIAPGMVLGDARLDSWAPGGVPSPGFIQGWWEYRASRWAAVRASAVAEGDTGCVAQVDRNTESAEPYNLTTMTLQHPLRDAWMEQRHLAARTHDIEVPVLSFETFQDEAVTSREDYYQETLDPERVWMVQSNGGHDLYESLQFRKILVAFMDHFVKGEDNGFEKRPHIEVWMDSHSPGHGYHEQDELSVPRYSFTLPRLPVAVTPRAFALSGQGTLLAQDAGQGEPDAYNFPSPSPKVDAEFVADTWGPNPEHWLVGGSLGYTSEPLQAGFMAYGPASADLWLSSSTTDTDLQVTLTELRPDGTEQFIQRGVLRVSNRAVDEARSTTTHVVLKDQPGSIAALTPGVPVLARVELNKFAHAFREGSRIRLWIDTPSQYGGNSFDVHSVAAINRVWHDARHPSRLVLGTLPGIGFPAERAPCGSILREPCRLDPWAEVH